MQSQKIMSISVKEGSKLPLDGATSLHQDILDLLFNLNLFDNYSSLINGLDTFVPNNKFEKVLLLGLLKRSIIIFGTHEKPLVQPRFTDVDKLFTLSNELILSLVKYNQHDLLLKLIESIVCFSNYNSSIIVQYALLLHKFGCYKLALEYFILVSNIAQASYLHFIIIYIYYVHLNDFESGITWCHKSLNLKDVHSNKILKSKCHMYLGIGYYWKYLTVKDTENSKWNKFIKKNKMEQETNEVESSVSDPDHSEHYYQIKPHDIVLSNSVMTVKSESMKSTTPENSVDSNSSLLEQSIFHLMKALQYDSHNHLLYYYLALVSAQGGNVMEAMTYIKQSLDLHNEHLPSLHLLVLLESTCNLSRAETLLQSTIREYPDNVQLYMTQACIHMNKENYTEGIDNLREALLVWEKLYCDKEGDISHIYNDNDSGQFSVDYKDKLELYNILGGNTENIVYPPDLVRDMESGSKDISDTQNSKLQSVSRHVTFVPLTPSKDYYTDGASDDMNAIYDEEDDLVKNFLKHFNNKFNTAKICHDKMPNKLCLLIDIWSMFARIYLNLKSLHDFVQCLRELLHICDVTSSYVKNSVSRSTSEQTPTLVLSKHCVEILFHLGIYFKNKIDLSEAKFCFENVLSISHNHVESLYHLSCIEKDLGLFCRALHTIHLCVQLSDHVMLKGKIYYLMGEIFDCMGDVDKSCVCYEIALQMTESLPVCSYGIIPFVWQ